MKNSKQGTEVVIPFDVRCRLDLNRDVQLKTLAKIWQGSRQTHIGNRVIWTEQVWCVTRYYHIIKINILVINIIIVTTIVIIIIFIVQALSTTTKKDRQLY